ncbi:HAD family hydrolase [Paludifilum halophilum]|uniref:HAD family hydrolase n=1 Tax=Paludifilum halophilum TaxID=1642702 RepID=UPI001F0AB032|nr:HAD family hydrolase [Paludifilum halophilum]
MTFNGDKDLIFDMDGTLFQTETVAVPAFRRTFQRLRVSGRVQGERPTDERVCSVFGKTPPEIWDRLLPGSSEEVKEQADQWWLQDELDCLSEGMGALYPGVEEGLRDLRDRGWRLFIASNGLGPYVRGILVTFGLTSLFSGIYAAGEHQIGEKKRLVGKLIQEHQVTSGWMIGDRSSDVQAGKANGLPVIGCRYADFPSFGEEDELEGADQVIDSFQEILEIVD